MEFHSRQSISRHLPSRVKNHCTLAFETLRTSINMKFEHGTYSAPNSSMNFGPAIANEHQGPNSTDSLIANRIRTTDNSKHKRTFFFFFSFFFMPFVIRSFILVFQSCISSISSSYEHNVLFVRFLLRRFSCFSHFSVVMKLLACNHENVGVSHFSLSTGVC